MPSCRTRQVLRNSNRAPKQKSPPRRVPGGRKGGRPMLFDAVSTLASLGLEGLHGVPGLFHRASHEPAHRVLLPSHALHDLREGGAVLALQHGDHLGRLAARARSGDLGHRGGLLGRGCFLGGGGLLGYLTLGGRALGRPCATLGLAFGFGLGGWCRLLQIATSRFAGQDLASSANSGWLLKRSNGVVVAAAASSGVACAVMLLW